MQKRSTRTWPGQTKKKEWRVPQVKTGKLGEANGAAGDKTLVDVNCENRSPSTTS